ncbi:P-type ATPase [Heterostelium album PN500]|uniref:Sodium/potassium-transporting ATPase subunit alpha n=1 Tax=Heterostelium pallidum (strain ATCC 26659 / Pp 5 / PN500) TaxID=670386 RepID=D3BBA2_HETP5|nr:P-type ATPase [Heterostelium album PN500]EFA81309.1 P-type ATPase [Heterostelium album PN500]|eukprot:XP_020433427.1 P-type ATPase [Heterostelium album PN500]
MHDKMQTCQTLSSIIISLTIKNIMSSLNLPTSKSQTFTEIELKDRDEGSSSHHHHEGGQETQIPLYYSVVKEKQRRKGLKLRSRIKEKFKSKKEKKSNKEKVDYDQTDLTYDHSIPIEELAEKHKTSINFADPKYSLGITGAEAAERLERDGRNALTPTKSIPKWVKFLLQFTSLFPAMLEIGGILSFIAYGIDPDTGSDNLYLGIILWAVVIITCTFTFFQESKSANVLEGFKKMAPASCKVMRDGHLIEINSELLVVGDVVHIRMGDKVPADVRVLFAHHFKVDNSSLTGESEPQTRTPECTDQNALETQNLAFYSTLAVDGDCVGIVVSTGDNTTIGKIAKLASKAKPSPTPLQKELNVFIRIITVVAIAVGLILLTVGFATKVKWIYIVIFVIGVVVAQVPEGLLPTITVALTLTAKRMSKKNVLVKNLLAVETFGSTRTIASDKTGTLTQNIMTVVHLWYDGTIYSCDANTTSNYFNKENKTFQTLYKVSALCNKTVFDRSDENFADIPIQQRKCIGDASESALLKFCENVSNVESYRALYPKIFEIPFNSVNKWHLTICYDNELQKPIMLMKGAPERIIKICSKILINGEEETLTDKYRNDFLHAYEFLAGKGERALGMAMLELNPEIYHKNYIFDSDEKNFPTDDLVFVGLTTLMDPPRPGVPEAVAECKRAGVRVMMVTGDHPLTATSIAKQVGIIEGETLNEVAKRENIDVLDVDFEKGKAIVIPGSRLDDLTQSQWDKILALQQVVFARTSPEQKLMIVEQCQNKGDIVAVTGDGVNDSPALKKADLGCAMGITGSEVAKEAASIVLLDDNFSSIVAGIEEGRMIFDKLKKSICYTLSSNIPELLPFVLFFLIKLPTALSGILILCIDLGTDLVPVISYAYESAEMDIMSKPPRNIKKERLVSLKLAVFSYIWLGFVQCAAGFVNYFVLFRDYGISASDLYNTSSDHFMVDSDEEGFMGYNLDQQKDMLREAQTAYFVAVVLVRLGAALSCKTRKLSIFQHGFKNMVFNIGVISMLAVALIIVHVPGIRTFFGTTIIGYKFWLIPLPFAFFLVTMNELRLYLIRRNPGTWIESYLYW